MLADLSNRTLAELRGVLLGEHEWRRAEGLNDESVFESRHIQSASGIGSFAASAVNLIARTAWLFAREEIERAPVDYLFIDEAGQVSLADALAIGTCARNLVFLGDPMQLAQVTNSGNRHTALGGRPMQKRTLGTTL